MIRSGDSIENPVPGERLVFHQTSADTRGERVVFETFVRPNGFVAAAHVHPFQAGTRGAPRPGRAERTIGVDRSSPRRLAARSAQAPPRPALSLRRMSRASLRPLVGSWAHLSIAS
jgi:hypothetical protein